MLPASLRIARDATIHHSPQICIEHVEGQKEGIEHQLTASSYTR